MALPRNVWRYRTPMSHRCRFLSILRIVLPCYWLNRRPLHALTWQTGAEVDNAGFNLHRATAAGGPYTQINDALIPAKGDPVSGASYVYTDTDVIKRVTYYYKLEDVDIHGVRAFHGPVSVTPSLIHRVYLPLVFK